MKQDSVSIVRPKLPDYGELAARFEELKFRNVTHNPESTGAPFLWMSHHNSLIYTYTQLDGCQECYRIYVIASVNAIL